MSTTAVSEDQRDLEVVRPQGLAWVAPLVADTVVAGEPVDLAVYTQNADATVVHFVVDGAEVGACDPSDDGNGEPDTECLEDNVWRAATTLDAPGTHHVGAWFTASDGSRIATERDVIVLASAPDESLASGAASDPDPVGTEPPGDAPSDVVVQALDSDLGFLDPNSAWQSVAGGTAWRSLGHRIVLRGADAMAVVHRGDVDAVARCMQRYGTSIERYADLGYVSRATVASLALARNGCRDPQGGHNAHGWGPMEVPARACAALTRATTVGPGSSGGVFSGNLAIAASQCRQRMAQSADFSFDVGVRYIASLRRKTHGDPVRIAAAYDVGAVRRSSANEFHVRTTPRLLDRFVRFYNSYATWEARDPSAQTPQPEPMGQPGDQLPAIGLNNYGIPNYDPFAGHIGLTRQWFTYATGAVDYVADGPAPAGTPSDPAHLVGATCPVDAINTPEGLVASAACNGVAVLGELIRADPMLPAGHPPVSASDWADWDTHVSRVVRRYGPGGSFWSENPAIPTHPIQAWEIWNEENTTTFWGGLAADPATYADIAWHAHRQLRAIDPNARVLVGGMTPGFTQNGNMDSRDYLWRVFEQPNGACAFDGVAFHPYTGGARAPAQAVVSTGDLYPILSVWGLHGPGTLWITEFGWHVLGDGAVSEQVQQANTQGTFDLFAPMRSELGLGPVLLWTFADSALACLSGPDPASNCTYHGVFGVDPSNPAAPARFRPVWTTLTSAAAAWGNVQLPPARHCGG